MKKTKTFKTPQLCLFLAACLGYATAAPYGPDGRSTEFTQPNGTVLQLKVFGDEFYGRTETADGYTVVYNSKDGAYHYATVSADGASLIPSGKLATGAAPAGLARHLDLSAKKAEEIHSAKSAETSAERDARWSKRLLAKEALRTSESTNTAKSADAEKNAAPVSGSKVGLTILVRFPNDPRTSNNDGETFPTNRDKIVRFCNTEGYTEDGNTGSVRDFFYDQSGGKLTYTQTVTSVITMPQPKNYYNFSDYPTNKVYRGNASRVLVLDAVKALKAANFDFSSLTVNGSNQIEATNLFFAGKDSGVYAQGLWPQQWSLQTPFNVGTTANPRYISAFQMTNLPNSTPVIGTFCHENGHLILDYPDIYALTSEGVGEHCLMGSGNYLNDGKTPAPINAHFKDLVGWATVTEITAATFATANLTTTGNVAYRIRKPGTPTESFVFENRGNGDRWAQYANDKGIAIWHIDERIGGNTRGGAHYGVAVEQADGNFDLENGRNRGDNEDFFDLSSPNFTDSTSPNARWWDGSRSFIDAKVLSAPGATVSVAFAGVLPNTIIVDSPNGGEVVYPGSRNPILWRANITGNVKIDLYKAGAFHSVISANEKNDGAYTWVVPDGLPVAADYSVRITALTNAVATLDDSDVNFQVTAATFPANNVMPLGWFKPKGTTYAWKISKSPVFEGKRSLVASSVGDGKRAAISFRAKFVEGNVSFYLKTSTEQSFDFARFYIDGVPQKLDGNKTGLSGNTDWTSFTFPLPAGKHTLTWTYEKDDSYAQLRDMVWLDGVTLPETTQNIAVQSDGKTLVNGESSLGFPSVSEGSASSAKTIKIVNKGSSHLYGLKLATGGSKASNFKVSALKVNALAPGASTTVNVAFTPDGKGDRSATLQVLSNDADEGKFVIGLTGTGLGLPQIGIFQPGGEKLSNGDTRNFGIANVGSTGNSKVFTVKNLGSENLSNLSLSIKGKEKGDFQRGTFGQTTLAPGESTTFTISFRPTGKDLRSAVLHIGSNDKRTGKIAIKLTGKGAPKVKSGGGKSLAKELVAATLGSSADSGSSVASARSSVSGVEVVGGQKYLSLTIRKQAGQATGTVEVSPNLLDWYSGSKHTTVLVDDATTLKVRDNTPVTRDAKRFIRVK